MSTTAEKVLAKNENTAKEIKIKKEKLRNFKRKVLEEKSLLNYSLAEIVQLESKIPTMASNSSILETNLARYYKNVCVPSNIAKFHYYAGRLVQRDVKIPEIFYELGHCYENAMGVEQNFMQSLSYYLKAKSLGEQRPFHTLVGKLNAYLYSIGKIKVLKPGVTFSDHLDADSFEPLENLEITYTQNDRNSHNIKGFMMGVSIEVSRKTNTHQNTSQTVSTPRPNIREKLLTPVELKNYSLQEISKLEHESKENTSILNANLAFYFKEVANPRNVNKFLFYAEKASKGGIASASFVLGECYAMGVGCAQNIQQAVRYFELSKKQGDKRSFAAVTLTLLKMEPKKFAQFKDIHPDNIETEFYDFYNETQVATVHFFKKRGEALSDLDKIMIDEIGRNYFPDSNKLANMPPVNAEPMTPMYHLGKVDKQIEILKNGLNELTATVNDQIKWKYKKSNDIFWLVYPLEQEKAIEDLLNSKKIKHVTQKVTNMIDGVQQTKELCAKIQHKDLSCFHATLVCEDKKESENYITFLYKA